MGHSTPPNPKKTGRFSDRLGSMAAADTLCSSSRYGFALGLLILSGALSGCGMDAVAPSSGTVTLNLQGTVHGGQQPVSGSTLQVWAAGTGGNGTAASPLIPTGYYLPGGVACTQGTANCTLGNVLSDSNGNFSITGDYTCPGSNPQVYITATGGSPGVGSPNNPALLMMAALGPCATLQANLPNIYIDEVTTVAAAWALAPFMTSSSAVASSSTNYSTGLANAFANAQLLANTANGQAATLPTGLSIQTGKLYALADSLAGCVNSDGTAGCTKLFMAAAVGGVQPTNTLNAALNIVKNPGSQVTAVWNSIPTTPPFATTLTGPPNDWTMSLTVSGGGIYGPTQLAVDSQGNVWVADYFGAVSAFNPQGTALSPAASAGAATSGGFGNGTLSGIYGLAVDTNDNVFVTNQLAGQNSSVGNHGSISILNGVTSGTTLGSLQTNASTNNAYFYDFSIQYPESLATDTNGNIIIGDDGGSYATVYSSSGSAVAQALGNGFSNEVFGVSADAAHGAWLANTGDNTVVHADVNGGILSHPTCCSEASGIATDALGNAWVTNFGSNSVSEIAPGCDTNTVHRSTLCTGAGGNVVTLNQVTGGGLYTPQGIVVDAGQNVWVSNLHAPQGTTYGAIAELAGNSNSLAAGTAISPSTGYGLDAQMSEPFWLAVDPSGNIWVSDEGANTVVMFFGVATPTATPVGPTPTAP